jgi:glycosyltransferase involved in cell wall biosynthesis
MTRSVKHILLLAYHFPPLGGAGAQRNTKLVQHLPQHGYRITVITGPGMPDHRWAPIDGSLKVPPEVSVRRLPEPEPSWTGSRIQRWLRISRQWQRWWEGCGVPLAFEAGRDADVVYATISPYSTATAATTIARALGKPLVLDFEDPWAFDEMLVHETSLHARLERRAMEKALETADVIVMNTPEAAARVRAAFPHVAASIPVTSIVNGFHADDFAGPAPIRDNTLFRIVHTGSLHTELGRPRGLLRRALGGSVSGVNPLTRSLVYLRRALDDLLRERPELGAVLRLEVAGRLTAGDRASLSGLPIVREHGFLTHAATIKLIRGADLLFLPMHDLPQGTRASIVPCKTYEYLGSSRPILAAVPDGDARDFLAAAGHPWLCRPTDVAAMKAAILDALARPDRGSAPGGLLAKFERRVLTAEVAAVLESLLGIDEPKVATAIGACA